MVEIFQEYSHAMDQRQEDLSMFDQKNTLSSTGDTAPLSIGADKHGFTSSKRLVVMSRMLRQLQ